MSTHPEDRQQAIDIMTELLVSNGASEDQARKGATILVDRAIARREEPAS